MILSEIKKNDVSCVVDAVIFRLGETEKQRKINYSSCLYELLVECSTK